ncbi:MAG: hypothetical protein AAFR70_11845 [Pseudomonadota bacterium]
MREAIDDLTLEVLQNVRFRLEGGTVWLKLATDVIERDEERREALDAMLAQRQFLKRELDKLDAAITLCGWQWGEPKGGA